MTDAVMAELGEEEVQVLGKTLKALKMCIRDRF